MPGPLLSLEDLDDLEGLVQQHSQLVNRVERLKETSAQYDTTPAELPELEAKARILQGQLVRKLKAWLLRL